MQIRLWCCAHGGYHEHDQKGCIRKQLGVEIGPLLIDWKWVMVVGSVKDDSLVSDRGNWWGVGGGAIY